MLGTDDNEKSYRFKEYQFNFFPHKFNVIIESCLANQSAEYFK